MKADDGIMGELAAHDAPPANEPPACPVVRTCVDACEIYRTISALDRAIVDSPPMNKPSPSIIKMKDPR
jgi:hypothetical protein